MILVDLNVILDVFQAREPHYRASAVVLDRVVSKREQGFVAAHAVTTIHYLVGRYQTVAKADEAVDWMLRHFDVSPVGRNELLRARALAWPDFEDAVVAAVAESARCSCIVTRNIKDFVRSTIPALTPEEYLAGLDPA